VEKSGQETGQTNLSSTSHAFTETISAAPSFLGSFGPGVHVSHRVQAHYSGGDSAWSDWADIEPSLGSATIYMVAGNQGSAYLAANALSPGTASIRITRVDVYAHAHSGGSASDASWDIPLSAFADNRYQLSSAITAPPVDSFGQSNYKWWAQTINSSNTPSAAVNLGTGDYLAMIPSLKCLSSTAACN
jgi:hypothetical protein